MCANISKFKKDLLEGKDKWADKAPLEEEKPSENEEDKVEVKKQDLKNVVKDL